MHIMHWYILQNVYQKNKSYHLNIAHLIESNKTGCAILFNDYH